MWSRLARDVTLVLLVVVSVSVAVLVVDRFGFGNDAHAYWLVWHEDDRYSRAPDTVDAYLYSPAFAQLIWPLAQLPWPVFGLIFTLAPAIAFAWLLKPLSKHVAIACWLMTMPEIVSGNVYWLLALAAAVGLRHPSTWTIMAMTKITPCLGPVWFLVRGEWRRLGVTVFALAVVTGISYAIQPQAWHDWIVFLLENRAASDGSLGGSIFPPLVVRFPCAVMLLVWGALGGRFWTIPVAMVLSTPVIGIASFTMLCAIPRLGGGPRRVVSEPAE